MNLSNKKNERKAVIASVVRILVIASLATLVAAELLNRAHNKAYKSYHVKLDLMQMDRELDRDACDE